MNAGEAVPDCARGHAGLAGGVHARRAHEVRHGGRTWLRAFFFYTMHAAAELPDALTDY